MSETTEKQSGHKQVLATWWLIRAETEGQMEGDVSRVHLFFFFFKLKGVAMWEAKQHLTLQTQKSMNNNQNRLYTEKLHLEETSHLYWKRINSCRRLLMWTHFLPLLLSCNLWTSTSHIVNSIYKSNTLVSPPALPVMLLQPINLITCPQKLCRQRLSVVCCALNLILTLKQDEWTQLHQHQIQLLDEVSATDSKSWD